MVVIRGRTIGQRSTDSYGRSTPIPMATTSALAIDGPLHLRGQFGRLDVVGLTVERSGLVPERRLVGHDHPSEVLATKVAQNEL